MNLTVVVPCFNEEKRLPVEAFRSFVAAHEGVRFLFVDDGSRDGTLALLQRLVAELGDSRAGVLALPHNSGKGEAVRQGMKHAADQGAELIAFWDADLATPLAEVDRFVARFEERPELLLVMGSRVKLLGRDVQRRAVRHYLGRVAATAISILLDLAVYDTQCGAKMFRNGPVLRSMLEDPFVSRWLFDVELLARLRREASTAEIRVEDVVVELPLMIWRDVAGSNVKSSDFARAAADLYRIARRYRRDSPAR